MTDKIIIGTANFGLSYGIANKKKLTEEEVFEILTLACRHRIWGVDSAKAYGNAELVLGKFFEKHGKTFNIITKLPQKEYLHYKDVETEFFNSLNTLNVSSVDFLLIHSFETFTLYKKIIIPPLQCLCKEGIIGKYGISVYHTREMEVFLDEIKGDVAVEFPLNLFDQRFLSGNYLKIVKDSGNVLFARSIFLQGLFFLDETSFTGVFQKAKDKTKKLKKLALEYDIKPECIALLFAIKRAYIDGVIIGVDSKEQLMRNIDCLSMENYEKYRYLSEDLQRLKINDEEIILPYKWDI